MTSQRARDRLVAVGVGVVVNAVMVAFSLYAVVTVLRAPYPDLQSGNWFGPAEGFPDHLARDDDMSGWRLAGADQLFAFPVVNDGDRQIVVAGARPTDRYVTDIRWRVYRDAGDGGSIAGLPSSWRAFPAVVPAEGQIVVRFTVRRVDCPALGPGGAVGTDGQLRLDWFGGGGRRSTDVDPVPSPDSIEVCVG